MPTRHKTAVKCFLQTAATLAALMLLEAGLILGCILWPENKALPLLAGIAAMWALVAFGFAVGRFYKHVIKPCTENEKTVQALARGDFPPPTAPRVRELFPDLSRSVNLLRDRLQYLESSLRDRQTREQSARRDGAGAVLQARVYSRLLTRVFPPLVISGSSLRLPRPDPAAIAEQTDHALREIRDLVDALRTDAREEDAETFDLNLFLRDFDETAQTCLNKRRMSLSCGFGADLPAALHGSRQWLTRELKDLLRILAQESEDGRRLELVCGAENGAVEFTFADPLNGDLAADFQKSQDADSGTPGEETALTLLELRLAAVRARYRQAELAVEEHETSGSRLRLTLDREWIAAPDAGYPTGHSRFVESTRHTAPAAPDTGHGVALVIAREPEFAGLLAAQHPETEWIAAAPEQTLPARDFRRILAIIPAEIAARHLEKLENVLCRAALRGASVAVVDPGMHRRFRRHLRECGIRDIADMPDFYRAGGDA